MFAFSYEVFAHVNEYREVFRAMVGKRSGAMVEHLVHKLLVDVIRDDVKASITRGHVKAHEMEGLVQFLAGGLFGLIGWWLGSKDRLSVDEANSIFRRLAVPAMKAARG